jgi:predicted O-methyltransferase YrrM
MSFLRPIGGIIGGLLRHGIADLVSAPPQARAYWRRLARAASRPAPREPAVELRLPVLAVPTDDFTVPAPGVTLLNCEFASGEMLPMELVWLCRFVRQRQPRVIFEIGTFNGGTTLQLAANSAATVYTLDLPPQNPAATDRPVWDAALDVYPTTTGARFLATPQAQRIRQLFGDSQMFDYSPYHATCDLVFVDACHHYEFVMKDSQNALRLLRPGGAIVWHDYAAYAPGVVRALEELSATLPLCRVEGTSLVLYDSQ